MTQICVNNEKTNITLRKNETVQDVMTRILDEVISPEEVVTGINVNNKELSFEEENDVLTKDISSFQNINFSVQPSKQLALESLDSCETYIDTIIAKVQNITADYQQGEEQRANQNFAEALETIDLFTQLVTRINKTLAQQFQEDFKKSESIQNLEIHLLSILKTMIPARENNDIIMLCDLLEYELVDNLKEWKTKAIPELKKMRDS